MTAVAPRARMARSEGWAGRWLILRSLMHRSWLNMVRIPASIVPAVVMPVFFVIAFSGTFRGLTLLPGFPTDNAVNWMAPYACLQGAAFAGLASAFGLGRDIEGGFYDRLLLSPAPRWTLVVSSLLYSALRSFLPLVVVLLLGLPLGLTFPGGPVAVLWLAVASVGVAAAAGLWGMGITYRLRSQSAGALAQVGIFVVLFLSEGQTPVELQSAWLPHVARFNPLTPVMRLARAGFVGDATWAEVWPGLAALVISLALLAWFAARGFRKLLP